ncbi:hypothetical protein [Streptomyces sp. GSL17-111]|uniref:hypothetical protein n=1 Tax=Streptomyces sp. GSL17-111 TaxID=3121596 RepID=UPI0030F4810F
MTEGYALLVAGEGSHGGAAALAGLPAALLLGAGGEGPVAQVTAPLEPEQARAALRAAAGHGGRLLVEVMGRVALDRWCGEPYLALGAGSVRYEGLPWAWLNRELWPRPAGSTTVVVDLAVGEDVAGVLEKDDWLLAVEGAAVMGVVCGPRRAAVVGGYSVALAAVLRERGGPVPAAHGLAVARAGLVGRAGVRVLGPASSQPPASGTDTGEAVPHPAVTVRMPPRPQVPPMPSTPPAAPAPAPDAGRVPEGGEHGPIYTEVQAGRHSTAMAMAVQRERARSQPTAPAANRRSTGWRCEPTWPGWPEGGARPRAAG